MNAKVISPVRLTACAGITGAGDTRAHRLSDVAGGKVLVFGGRFKGIDRSSREGRSEWYRGSDLAQVGGPDPAA